MKKDMINGRFITTVQAILHENTGLSKTQLAETLGVKPAKFSEILNGRMKAGVDMLATMCEKYNVSARWLLLGEGDMILPKKGTDPTVRDCSSDCLSGVQNTQKSCSNGVQSAIDPIVGQLLNRLSAQAEEIGRLKREVEEAEERATAAMKRAETS